MSTDLQNQMNRWAKAALPVVLILCVLVTILQTQVHGHPYFQIEEHFAFYGWFGFLSCLGLTCLALVLRIIVKRKDDYYDQ